MFCGFSSWWWYETLPSLLLVIESCHHHLRFFRNNFSLVEFNAQDFNFFIPSSPPPSWSSTPVTTTCCLSLLHSCLVRFMALVSLDSLLIHSHLETLGILILVLNSCLVLGDISWVGRGEFDEVKKNNL